MERIFNITLLVPLGRRSGVLYLRQSQNAVSGTLETMGDKSTLTGVLSDDGRLYLEGSMHTPLRTFACRAEGQLTGRTLKLTVTGDRRPFCITGEEASAAKEAYRS